MKKFNYKSIIFYILLIIYILFSTLIGYKYFNNVTNYIITPLFWIIISILSFSLNKDIKQRIKFQSIKNQTIFIIVTIYLIIYFLLGLLLGYARSAYNHNIIGIIKNIWSILIPVIFIEYNRTVLVNSNKSILNNIIITIIFTLASINIYNLFLNNNDTITLFKNFSSVLIPTLTSNILLVYLSKTCGYSGNLFFRIPQVVVSLSLPILPNLDWYYTAMLGILLPLFIFIFINNKNNIIEKRESKRIMKKNSILKLIPLIIPLIIFIYFVAGLFKYKPTAILSNSMKPIFERGDIVIVEKINRKNFNNIKKYDIIEYIIDGSVVAHRIINIEKHNDGSILLTTKGDNNNAPDIKKVEKSQIKGIIKASIPKVGYPSVWLNEFFNKNKTISIETGKNK